MDEKEQEQQAQGERPETVEETAKRVWDEMQAGSAQDEPPAPAGDEDEAGEGEEPAPEDDAHQDEQDAQEEAKEEEPKDERRRERRRRRRTIDIEKADPGPSPDWATPVKEWYNALPPELEKGKRELARIAHEAYAWRQQQHQQISRRAKEVEAQAAEIEECTRVVQQWLPRWGQKGVTPAAALMKLCTFNDGYIRNPVAAVSEMAKLAGLQITIHNAPDQKNVAHNSGPPQPINEDEILERVERRIVEREQGARLQQAHAAVTAEVAETLEDMAEETTEDGRYVYPDIQDPGLLQRLQPLASAIGRANPQLGWREILKRAYRAADGRVIPRRSHAQPARLNNGQPRNEAARRAARSVPGSLSSSHVDLQAEPGESVLATAERVYKAMYGR